MPGADTWSAKEYKGFVYTGDMGRGFDVYGFARCDDVRCLILPTSSPGTANGCGGTSNSLAELAIVQGISAGGRVSFSFNVQYAARQVAPSGSLTFIDHGLGKKVKAIAVDFFRVTASAEFGGSATVNGTTTVRFSVVVQDNGATGDSFRIVLSDGYLASGTLTNGNVTVSSP